MKKLLVIFLALTFVLAMISLAFGSKYNSPPFGTGNLAPHYGFADTSDNCESCHAVHLAQGSYKLLRNNSPDTACAWCHGIGASGSAKIGVTLNTSGHGGNPNSTIFAPDDAAQVQTLPTGGYRSASTGFGCADCHSVHARNVIGALVDAVGSGTTARLLKGRPDIVGTDSASTNNNAGATVALSTWCSACHGANVGTYGQSAQTLDGTNLTTSYGHNAGTVGISTVGYSGITVALVSTPVSGTTMRAPRCNQCHAAGAARGGIGSGGWVSGQNNQVDTGTVNQPVYFPHSGYWNTYSYSLLKSQAASSANMTDDVCNDCHYTPSLP